MMSFNKEHLIVLYQKVEKERYEYSSKDDSTYVLRQQMQGMPQASNDKNYFFKKEFPEFEIFVSDFLLKRLTLNDYVDKVLDKRNQDRYKMAQMHSNLNEIAIFNISKYDERFMYQSMDQAERMLGDKKISKPFKRFIIYNLDRKTERIKMNYKVHFILNSEMAQEFLEEFGEKYE